MHGSREEAGLKRTSFRTFAPPHLSPFLADFGVEKKASLEGLDEKAVEKQVAALCNSA